MSTTAPPVRAGSATRTEKRHTLPQPYTVEVLSPAQLCERTADWDDLASQAIEANAFQESWMLASALHSFGKTANLKCILIWWFTGRPQDPRQPLLCGLLILEERPQHRLPVRVWGLWRHDYAFLGTPLIRQGHATQVLETLFEWVQQHPARPQLLEWELVHGEGPFHKALIDVTRQRKLTVHAVDTYNRALLLPDRDDETYAASAMTCHNRQELRRQRKRLQELGPLEFRVLEKSEDLAEWIEIFLALEGAGWKGNQGTALRERSVDSDYFREIARAAFKRDQLLLCGLFLADQPIAVKCNFLTGRGGFAFKIGFDESLSRFSPGVQLELEHLRWVHESGRMNWVDSCAAPVHFMINRLWKDRRTIQKVLISTGHCRGEIALGLLALWHGCKRGLAPWRPTFSKKAQPGKSES